MQSTGTRLAQSKLAEVEAGVVSPSESSSGTCDGEPGWSYAIDSGGRRAGERVHGDRHLHPGGRRPDVLGGADADGLRPGPDGHRRGRRQPGRGDAIRHDFGRHVRHQFGGRVMIASPPAGRRGGYTLLEVLLATVIALFLLAGLYVALDITLVRMDASRDVVTTERPEPGRRQPDGRGPGRTPSARCRRSPGRTRPRRRSADSRPRRARRARRPRRAAAAPASSTTTGGATTGAAVDATQTATAVLPFGLGLVGSDAEFTVFCSRLPAAVTDVDAGRPPATWACPGTSGG